MNSIVEIHRKHKLTHPEQYCAAQGCLSWTFNVLGGTTPCPEHEPLAANNKHIAECLASLSEGFPPRSAET